MATLHCALENGADLYVNERQHYRASSTEERRRRRRRKKKRTRFFTSRCAYVNLRYVAMLYHRYYTLYIHSIGKQPLNMMVVFKMRDSVPSARYSSVCNVLRLWRISLIPTYNIESTDSMITWGYIYRIYRGYIYIYVTVLHKPAVGCKRKCFTTHDFSARTAKI